MSCPVHPGEIYLCPGCDNGTWHCSGCEIAYAAGARHGKATADGERQMGIDFKPYLEV